MESISSTTAVAININSPGGSPVQSELIYQRIRELSGDKKIPVFNFAQDVAASGGYFLALAGDEIYAHDASIIGSMSGIFLKPHHGISYTLLGILLVIGFALSYYGIIDRKKSYYGIVERRTRND